MCCRPEHTHKWIDVGQIKWVNCSFTFPSLLPHTCQMFSDLQTSPSRLVAVQTGWVTYLLIPFFFTWKRLPGRWAGLAGSPVCRRSGSFWWWRSTWRVEWTSRATPAQTPRWRRRSPAFFPSLTDRSSPGFYPPPGTRCRMGSTWQGEEELKVRTSDSKVLYKT